MLARAPKYRDGWHLPSLAENQDILRRYQTPGTTASYTGPVGSMPSTQAQMPRAPAITFSPPPAAPVQQPQDSSVAPAQNSIQRWQQPAASTVRFDAREQARQVGRRSPSYQDARAFLRIDGSAPQSLLDAMAPAPVEFAGRKLGNGRSFGFEGTAADTASDIATGDFKWKKPLSYGDLQKKYSFPTD